jgi:branched-chain amino acid transport system permease protein
MFLVVLTGPSYLSGYWVRLLTNIFMFGVLTQGVNIIAGYCGYLSLGNILFFGLGSYITAVLMVKFMSPFSVAFLASGAGAVLFSVVVGLPILRLKGQYFLMATLALSELMREITSILNITGGGRGITLPLFVGGPALINTFFYYFMLGLLVTCTICVWWIDRGRLGLAFKAIKFDEDAASVMGINPPPYKTVSWAISALFTGFAGSGFAYWMGYIDPGVVYEITPSIKMYLMMVLGGAGTVWGPIAGAFFIELISEFAWSRFLEFHFLIVGLILIFTVLFTPKGLMDLMDKKFTFSLLTEGIRKYRI